MPSKIDAAKVTLIIPVYNEGPHIRETLEGISQEVSVPYVIHMIYDMDEDTTIEPARAAGRELGISLKLIKNTRGRGVIHALKTGLASITTEYGIVTMADLSDPPEVINAMVKAADREGADIVCASRYMPGGEQIGGPFVKSKLSRWAGLSLKHLLQYPTHDATNNFKLYRRSFLERVSIESSEGFELGLELVVKAHQGGFKITEVPTTWRDREWGSSNFKLMKWLPAYMRWYQRAFL